MSELFQNNKEASRYELIKEGETAYADYTLEPPHLVISYVFAPDALRGTGAESTLMRHIAEAAKANNMTITPQCGYAAAWLRKHKDYSHLVAE